MFIIVDIIILAFIVINGFIGYRKGLSEIAINLASLILALLLGFILKGSLASFVDSKTNISSMLETTISEGINSAINSQTPSNNAGENIEDGSDNTQDVMQDTSPKNSFYVSLVNKMGIEDGVDNISKRVVNFILQTASFIIIFIVVSLCMFIIKMMLNLVFKLPILSSINGIGGLVAATIISLFQVWVVLAILSFLSPMVAGIGDMINSTYITRALYNINLIVLILSGGLKF